MLGARWDLSDVYPSLQSQEFAAAVNELRHETEALERYITDELAPLSAETDAGELGAHLGSAINRLNQLSRLGDTVRAYIYAFVTTDSHDSDARKKFSEYEQIAVWINQVDVLFKGWIGRLGPALDSAIAQNETVRAHTFILQETAEQARYLMSEAEEALAAELSLSGGNAWSKLQGTVTSQLTVDFELDGEVRKLPMPALINLHAHPDESVRRRAHEAELAAWASVRETLAACLNGVKGEVITLDQHRGRSDALQSALEQARIDRPTLTAMLAAMEGSFPMFRRYFKAKAKRIGKERLAWWDVFAPAGSVERQYTFEEARTFVLKNFATFGPELRNLAERAFDKCWIDAEPREGKRGGAFCMGLPAVQESRILCNFDGSLDQVSTIAHELGHAFHNQCAFATNKTELQKITPMTLAETASILCETIVMEAALAQASDRDEELAIIETSLIGSAQVIVDIYSRFLFEREVFERRVQGELSADDLCEIMARSQLATYGDGLDPMHLHPYMWTWKSHYYRTGLSFYNFPYAFGLLFATGLYAIYQARGAAFVPDYLRLLASTGEASAADLAGRFGIDIRERAFWDASLATIARRVDRYCELVNG